MLTLASPLTAVPGVGPVLKRTLGTLQLHTVRDLIWYLPLRYDDFSKTIPIRELKIGEQVTIRGTIQLVKARRSFRRRLTITEALVGDGTGTVKAVWFNLPYLAKSLKLGEPVLIAGKLTESSYGLQLEHPVLELDDRGLHTGRLVPRYPLAGTLTHRQLRTLVARVLPLTKNEPDWLPPETKRTYQLPNLGESLATLHFPPSPEALQAARKRLTFDELLLIHLQAQRAKAKLKQSTAPNIPFATETKNFVAKLPWHLTQDQRVAAWEIIQSLGEQHPMYRLLQGDVGSGKTIVAGIAGFNVSRAGLQTVVLAPTEILAAQHYRTLRELYTGFSITVGLLTRGTHELSDTKNATAAAVRKRANEGSLQVLIGTHAILQKSITLPKLGLIVVDEQHRFGVSERQQLTSGSKLTPHFLSMTATPIPRSLALTVYGDLDLSLIKHLPPGRQPITTRIVAPSERSAAYALMQREVEAGNRVFIVCPLIEESDTLGVRAATAEHERLMREVFPKLKLGLLHGKLSAKDKTRIMQDFKTGASPILVTTAVIEVGVDVAEATVMAIEGAERFGLAQLHQFRGRVGRSTRPSTCLLMTDNPWLSDKAKQRLQAMVRYQSGFELAEFDLTQRGPGDLMGDTQSGFLNLRFAELANVELLEQVRRAAQALLAADPTLTRWPQVEAKLIEKNIHPE